MENYDVLAVGGGPAGSSFAWSLRGRGLAVAVLDKRTFPRDKVCAGWVTPAVIQALEIDLDEYRRDRVLEPVHGFKVSVMGGKEVSVRYEGPPISYGIRRVEFDDFLLARSKARLILGEPLSAMRRDGDAWVVNGRIRARLLVGAGGHFCPVARRLAPQAVREDAAILAQEIEFPMSGDQAARCPVRPELPELFFSEDLKGYAWVFRKGGFLNVGVGREDDRSLSDYARVTVARLKKLGRIPQDAPEAWKGHAYVLRPNSRRPLARDGALLIGDAAGLAYAKSGEGIRPAVESGLLAARAVIEAEGDFSAASLQRYARWAGERFGEGAQARLALGLPEPLWRLAGRRLFASSWFVRHVLLDRWFLHSEQAALRCGRA